MTKPFAFVALACLVSAPAFCADPAYRPLWLYQGSWTSTDNKPGSAPIETHLKNDCAMAGKFFVCQQTVNGKPSALIVFIPAASPGSYYTQAVLPEGYAAGRGELRIDGDHWTYSGKEERDGKTIYSRTTNVFTGKDRIHYEQSESTDGKNWKVLGSGDEVRSSKVAVENAR